ncbi:putative cell wall protein [Vicia villosa]|uniref:putative cell wall protein n=1 Tax=Vicia villosa TaxID=3911 RepID=UPI00273CCB5B|nr:putative cell wall protein [Vicia villosa]
MAQRAYSFSALLLIFNILLVTTLQAAGRSIGKNSDNNDEKIPRFSVHYPSIGHLGSQPRLGRIPNIPFIGGIGGSRTRLRSRSESSGRRYIPGNDDTFIPNPGFEVPIPGGGRAATTKVFP